MTQPPNPAVTVTQADREAAADLIETYWPSDEDMQALAARYRAGHTQGVWAHAFARHRQSIPVAAGVGEGLREAVDALYQITNLTETEVWQEPRFVLEMAQEALAALSTPPEDLHARDALLLGGDAMRGEGQ